MRPSLPMVSVTAALLFAAGCGKKDENKPPQSEPAATAPGESAEPVKQTLAEAIGTTTKPGLFGPFAKAHFGMTKDEVKAVSPAFEESGDYLAADDYGISYFASFDGEPKKLSQLRVGVPGADVALLAERWGAPTEITYRRKPASVWLDPEAKIRALAIPDDTGDAGQKTIVIAPYLPVTEILGEPGEPLGIETAQPFLGATADQLKAAYPDHFDRSLDTLAFMHWPPDDFGDQFQLELRQKEGKVVSLQFWIHHGDNDQVKQAMLAALEAKFGKAKPVKSALGLDKLQLAADPPVTVGETQGAWVVEIGE